MRRHGSQRLDRDVARALQQQEQDARDRGRRILAPQASSVSASSRGEGGVAGARRGSDPEPARGGVEDRARDRPPRRADPDVDHHRIEIQQPVNRRRERRAVRRGRARQRLGGLRPAAVEHRGEPPEQRTLPAPARPREPDPPRDRPPRIALRPQIRQRPRHRIHEPGPRAALDRGEERAPLVSSSGRRRQRLSNRPGHVARGLHGLRHRTGRGRGEINAETQRRRDAKTRRQDDFDLRLFAPLRLCAFALKFRHLRNPFRGSRPRAPRRRRPGPRRPPRSLARRCRAWRSCGPRRTGWRRRGRRRGGRRPRAGRGRSSPP